MCNSVINTYKKHLPVDIYLHSGFIEPVEITALQIIYHCEICGSRFTIGIYMQFKKN